MTRSRQTADWGSRAGLAKVIPSSVAVGSGTGSANATGTVTFSGVSSVSLNDVFSTTYTNYRIVLNDCVAASGSQVLNIRYRVSGSDNTTSNYSSNNFYVFSSSGFDQYLSQSSNQIATVSEYGNFTFDILNPFASSKTALTGTCVSYQTNVAAFVSRFYGGIFNATTSFTGLTIYPAASTISGTITVYGYN